jgi:predicted permease
MSDNAVALEATTLTKLYHRGSGQCSPSAGVLASAVGFQGLGRKVLILQTSPPAAALPLPYSLRFKCRPDWVTSNLLVSTLASAVSLSVVLAPLP